MSAIAPLCSLFSSLLKHTKSKWSSDVDLKQFFCSVIYSVTMDALVSLPKLKQYLHRGEAVLENVCLGMSEAQYSQAADR